MEFDTFSTILAMIVMIAGASFLFFIFVGIGDYLRIKQKDRSNKHFEGDF